MRAEAEAVILNKYGFHVRPTTSFTKLANTFSSQITVEYQDQVVDAKSVIGLMSLGAIQGARIRIIAEGEDAEEAVAALRAHVDDRFGGID